MRIDEIEPVSLHRKRKIEIPNRHPPEPEYEIGTLRGIDVYFDTSDRELPELQGWMNKAPVFVIELIKRKKNIYYISLTRLAGKFQGFGFMPELYAFVLNAMPGFQFQSGSFQSPGGHKVWQQLSMRPDVLVYTVMKRQKIPLEYDPDSNSFEPIRATDDIDVYGAGNRLSLFAVAANKQHF